MERRKGGAQGKQYRVTFGLDGLSRLEDISRKLVKRDHSKISETGKSPLPPSAMIFGQMQPVRDYSNPEVDPIKQFSRAQPGDLIERGFFGMFTTGKKEGVFWAGRIAEVGRGIVGQNLVGQSVAADMASRQLDLDLGVQIGVGEYRLGNGCRLVRAEIEQEATDALCRLVSVPREFFSEYGCGYGANQIAYIHETALRSGFSTYAQASESRRSMPSVRSRFSSLSELA